MKRCIYSKFLFILFAMSAFAFVMTSCDGDCFEDGGNFKKNYIEKAAPGSQPIETNVDEC